MPTPLRIVIGQLNFAVGDIAGNTQKIIQAIALARDTYQAQVILFPELAITGYSPEDLLLRSDFLQEAENALQLINQHTFGIDVILGYPQRSEAKIYNAAVLLRDGKQIANYHKQYLPNYGVFDEKRYFSSATTPCIVDLQGIPTAIIICEDIWFPEPACQAAAAGARLILCLNASPFSHDKYETRLRILQQRTLETQLPIVYAHNVGGQDEVVFDGGSMVIDGQGQLRAHAGFFQEVLFPIDLAFSPSFKVTAAPLPILANPIARIYQALVLAVRDYVTKNNFPGALLGLSGGIDSALTLAIAVDALGKDKVHAVLLPSRFTSSLSIDLARQQAQLLDIQHSTISIDHNFQSFLDTLAPAFVGKAEDITEENLQSRCRGVILMALSNKTGKLVLTTGNKSEMSVGYATLYGDMAGGFAVLKDVWKTMVFELARYRNQINLAIPTEVITRPPTAELKLNQTDQDSLPPYAELDEILIRYIEQNQDIQQICAAGYEPTVVKRIVRLVKLNEYKRRQYAPGPKVTNRAFGRERRYPITSGFVDF